MTKAEKIYLQILQHGLTFKESPTPSPSLAEREVEEVAQLAMRQGTGAMVFDQLLKTLPPDPFPHRAGETDKETELRMWMKQVCMQNMMQQEQWEKIIAKADEALAQKGIHAILLKGFGLAALYPKPYLRSWGDADIWVGKEQYHAACAALREAFPEAIHHDEEWEELKHYCYVFPDGKAIELHRVAMDWTDPKDDHYWQTIEKEELANGQNATIKIGDRPIATPEAKWNVLFVFLHAWEHFTGSGMPMKQLCDLALCVRRATRQGDAEAKEELAHYLQPRLQRLKLMEVWQMVGYVAVKTLGIEATDWPLLVEKGKQEVTNRVREEGERLLEQVIKEGQSRAKKYKDGSINAIEAREKAKQMNIVARKYITLVNRLESYRFLKEYAPRFARHKLWAEIKKGIRRTVRREGMIDY